MAGVTSAGALRQGAWGLTDQVVYSLTNFALSVLVARSVTQQEFGAFSVIFVAYVFVQGVLEAVVAEPFTVSYSATPRKGAAPLGDAAGCVVGAGIGLGVVILALSRLTSEAVGGVLPVFAIVLPGLLLQNLWRFAFFAIGRPRAAVGNDLVWAGAQIMAIVGLIVAGKASLNMLVLAWGGAGTVAAVVGILQAGVVPRPLRSGRWLAGHGSLSSRFTGEFVTLYGSAYLVQAMVGGFSGLAELAKLRGALVVFAPLNGLLNGLRIAVTPLGVRVQARAPGRLPALAVRLSLAVGAVALAWSAAALLLPTGLGEALLGDTWKGAREVVPAIAVTVVAAGLSVGAFTGLRAMVAARRSLRARGAIAVLSLVLGGAGAVLGNAAAAAAGLGLASMVGVVLMWLQYRLAVADQQRVDQSAGS